jgi:hypothetical protein
MSRSLVGTFLFDVINGLVFEICYSDKTEASIKLANKPGFLIEEGSFSNKYAG